MGNSSSTTFDSSSELLNYTNLPVASDSARSYIAVAALLTVNNLVYNTLFIILGAMVTQRGYDEQQIGLLGSAFLLGQLIANLSGAIWVSKVNWRYAIGWSGLGCAVFMSCGAYVEYQGLMAFYVLAGSMTGISLSCLFCHMSGMSNPVRAYSIALITQCLVAGTVIIILQSYVLPKFGFTGLSYTIAATFILALAAVPFIPKGITPEKTENRQAPKSIDLPDLKNPNKITARPSISFWPALGLVAIAVYFFGQTSIWAFTERIGNAKGFSADFIGSASAAVLILCAVGAWAADWTGKRWGYFIPIAIGIGLFILSILIMLLSNSKLGYFLSFLLYASAWNYVLPYQMQMVSQGDKNSVYASIIPAFQSVGATAGPATVGFLVVNGNNGYVPAYMLAVATAMASLAIFAIIQVKNRANTKAL